MSSKSSFRSTDVKRSDRSQSARSPSVESQLSRGGVQRMLYKGRRLAVFTSGGDSQGMNAALRAVVRMGQYLGCKVFFIREGYQGMVDGGANIVPTKWSSVSDIIQKGGTVIGSARCKAFNTREGRLKAAENLLKHQINNLVCIGGDGSLTGANCLRQEWPELVAELIRNRRVPNERQRDCGNINIVGLVGSIDNDFCGTDMTIGADSALHRIVEAVDAVTATAHSHQRSFVIEVMGRHCGYLALISGLSTEADWIFIPEWPARADWRDVMCDKMEKSRSRGQRTNIIIVAEGALDVEGKAITAELVKKAIVEKLKFDTRVTVLGHVQRGGNPSAFDRLLGCRMGAEAVMALMEMTNESEPCIVAVDGNQMVRVPLMQCVERTKAVAKALEQKNFEQAAELRGRSFQRNLEMYKLLTKIQPPTEKGNLSKGNKFNMAIMNVGPPACGMNAAAWAFTRIGLYHNCRVFGIENSFDGLIRGHIREMQWMDVAHWVAQGGSKLGTKRQTPGRMLEQVAAALASKNIHGLLIVGGFDAFQSALMMATHRRRFKAFCIPIVVIPATLSNNVPGSCFSLGTDTALNEICRQVDMIKQSAAGTKNRVFVIETMGGYCGYLATLSALATGADNAYIFEENFGVKDMINDVEVITKKLKTDVRRYLVTCSENANPNYNSDFIRRLYAEEGKDFFTVRANVLGHAQEGGSPTPFDRNAATKFAARAVEFLVKHASANTQSDESVYTDKDDTVVLCGIRQRHMMFTPIKSLVSEVSFDFRLPKNQWWLSLRPLLRILAKHESTYEAEAVDAAEQSSEGSME